MKEMRIDCLTLFPNMFNACLDESILKRARDCGLFEIYYHNIRDFSEDRHRRVDDYPYGANGGMVMTAKPVYNAYRHCAGLSPVKPTVIYMSPCGRLFNQAMAKDLALCEHLIFIAGHYEGIDERVIESFVDLEISIGDFVMTGGELPAMCVIDSVLRMVPGVITAGNAVSESHSDGLLEYPQYTRPEFELGLKVPGVLLSGHHREISKWRKYQSLKRTRERRPDLYEKYIPTNDDLKILKEMEGN